MKPKKYSLLYLQLSLLTSAAFLFVSGCSSASTKLNEIETTTSSEHKATEPSASLEGTHKNSEEIKNLIVQLGLKLEKRLDILETQVAGMNDKVDSARATMDRVAAFVSSTQKANGQTNGLTKGLAKGLKSEVQTAEVFTHPAEQAGIPVAVPLSKNDPEAGFTHDEPVQHFKKSMIHFHAQQFPESILSFSQFLEKYPDHPLAGSAQYYVGESYMKQKEYKLALQEFQRVLTSYDRSPHVADTLHEMILAEENLKFAKDAAKHRHLLTSLFPQSPAATIQPPHENLAPTDQAQTEKPATEKVNPIAHEETTPSLSHSENETPPTAPLPTAPLIDSTQVDSPHS